MTNEEIIEQCDKGKAYEYGDNQTVTHIHNTPDLLNLARADERAKIENGVYYTPTVVLESLAETVVDFEQNAGCLATISEELKL